MRTSPQIIMKWITAGVTTGALALALGLGLSSASWTSERLPALAVLAVLAIAATNLKTPMRSGLTADSSIMIQIASLVVFRERGLLVGPVVVGLCTGIDAEHLRAREFMKVIFNCSAGTLSSGAAAGIYWAVKTPGHQSVATYVVATGLASFVYLFVSTLLVSFPVSIFSQESYATVFALIMRMSRGAYPFAFLGLGLGWVYLVLSVGVVPLVVVPLLIARSAFASYLDVQAAQDQTIETLIHALEAKDKYTAGHAQRVAKFAAYVGSELALGPGRMERLRYAALMHDIGKLIVPNQLLNKPGKLTEAEFARVRRHESVSVALLGRIDFLAPVAPHTTSEAASHAVESGGLVEPGIVMVADAFDAMTSTRAYRKALTQETAFDELRKGVGRQFRADCVEALIGALEKRGERYGDGHETDVHEFAVAPPEVGVGSAGLGDLAEEHATS
jgi:hypothetical protein